MALRLDDVTLLTLYSVHDPARGSLCVAEYEKHIPFELKRIFYLYDLPNGVMRGQHAHRVQDQFLICLNGSVEVEAIRHGERREFTLSRPNEGIYFPPMTWLNIKVLRANTICLVLASDNYDESDYIRNFALFESLTAEM